jgi:hypothetical protein
MLIELASLDSHETKDQLRSVLRLRHGSTLATALVEATPCLLTHTS